MTTNEGNGIWLGESNDSEGDSASLYLDSRGPLATVLDDLLRPHQLLPACSRFSTHTLLVPLPGFYPSLFVYRMVPQSHPCCTESQHCKGVNWHSDWFEDFKRKVYVVGKSETDTFKRRSATITNAS